MRQKENARKFNSSTRLNMESELNSRRRVGSVKAAVNLYGDRIADVGSPKPSRARELHKAQSEIGRYKERRWVAESAKSQAESELSSAKKTAKELSSMIEKSSFNAKTQMRDMEAINKSGKYQERRLIIKKNENYDYAHVMKELEFVKQELSKLKLDVAAILEEKRRAEKEIEASTSKMLSCAGTAEVLRKEIEEAEEEQVLVELARIEALKELRDVEAKREEEAVEFSFELESTREKLKEAIEEIETSKELEMKLALTMSDIDLLQNELNLVKEMETRVQRNESMKHVEEGQEAEASHTLQSVTEELEAAKKELALVREEGFQFMASMDVIRNELKHVTAETNRLKKEESKVESTIGHLNSKLLRAKSKLEAVSAAEEKAKSIATNLSHTLNKLKADTEAAKKDKDTIGEEIATIKAETQKTEFEIDMSEERLQDTLQELEAAKTSEALALEKLKTLTENTMKDRALSMQHSSKITISKFEYEYLTNHAAVAKEIADKKVAAAQAWIEAIKASEKEILIKTKIAQREIQETRMEQAVEAYTKEKLLQNRVNGEELEHWPRKRERKSLVKLQRTVSRKSMKSNGVLTPSAAGRVKFQKSASPAARNVSPFPIKKKKKVILSLAKIFKGKLNKNETA
ncbi:hypothetical protein L6164_006454 [Bauhinia variegata]|uniref:Uncharacterized protein n=1 Tax=Bauhinia variegata TaxID=167791 RepID=A0ACB9PUC7_BAUVA|nr:hypothetical protein L6164_006454 [Bauhinia variegata]